MEFNDSWVLSSRRAFSICLQGEKMRKLGVWATYSGPHDSKRKRAWRLHPPQTRRKPKGASSRITSD